MPTQTTPPTVAAYGSDMTNAPRTPVRNIRVPDDLWDELERAARAAGIDRPTAIRQLIAWYISRPGMPDQLQRPDPVAWRAEPGSQK